MMHDLARWLFTPGDGGVFFATLIRFLVGFSALALSARYRKDRDFTSAALSLILAGWTLTGGLSSGYSRESEVSPYSTIWLLVAYALFVSIIVRRRKNA